MDIFKVPDSEQQKNEISGQKLDHIDPNHDVQGLFDSFNERFFKSMLGAVQLKWSRTMTSRAGICIYEEQGGLCTIKLSAPLLSPRPKQFLAETLLHEMIHAYLFVTQNFDDKEEHCPEFQKLMHAINKEAGMNIKINYQSPDEMPFDQANIWRCEGQCRDQQPYFGYVMKTEDTPPGPSDYWWLTHMQECGGNFKKISHEGENGGEEDVIEIGKGNKIVIGEKGARTFYRSYGPEDPPTSKPSDASSGSTAADESDKGECSQSNEQNEGDSGNSNKIEATPGTSQSSDDFQPEPGTSQAGGDFQPEPSTSQAGGDSESDSDSSDENFLPTARATENTGSKGKKRSSNAAEPNDSMVEPKRESIPCPVCGLPFHLEIINDHVNACMEEQEFRNEISPDEASNRGISPCGHCPVWSDYMDDDDDDSNDHVQANLFFFTNDEEIAGDDEPGADKVPCPCCRKWVKEGKINEHIDACLTLRTLQNNPDSP